MVRTAADMTVRQIISLLFDRVADELGVTTTGALGEGGSGSGMRAVDGGVDGAGEEQEEEGASGVGKGALRCAHLVFQVLYSTDTIGGMRDA